MGFAAACWKLCREAEEGEKEIPTRLLLGQHRESETGESMHKIIGLPELSQWWECIRTRSDDGAKQAEWMGSRVRPERFFTLALDSVVPYPACCCRTPEPAALPSEYLAPPAEPG